MKEIKLLVSGKIMPTPGQPVNLGVAFANQEIARKNGMKIAWAALTIENQFGEIITHYFFEKSKDKIKFFQNHILSSEWFTFGAKRKFLLALINSENLLKGKDKAQFETCLKKIVSLRNAHTHGQVVEKSNGTSIAYFEGSPQEKELDDDYWNNVEKTFEEAWSYIKKIQEKIGKTTGA
jgi:hypothetical protein